MAIWKRATVEQREEMVLAWLSGRYTGEEVAGRYEVSRTTLYAWVKRYRARGREGLVDLAPIAKSCPHKTSEEIEEKIIDARKRYGWGPKKLRVVLTRTEPKIQWPQPSTMGDILERHGLIEQRARRRKTKTPFRRKFEPAVATAPVTSASPFAWTDDALARLNRVPAGFMRDMTREEIEKVAGEKSVALIDLAVCEEGIGHARQTMNEVIAGYVSNKKPR